MRTCRRILVSMMTVVMIVAAFPMIVAAVTKSGWFSSQKGWSYYDCEGKKVTGWNSIEYEGYYFDEEGIMVTGWKEFEERKSVDIRLHTDGRIERYSMPQRGGWYYFGSNGKARIGWEKIGGKWYCFREWGNMYGGVYSVNGVTHYGELTHVTEIEETGEHTSRISISKETYFFDDHGVMKTGWVAPADYYQGYGGRWAYFNSHGAMLSGWQQIGGRWYFLEQQSDGWCVTLIGWNEINGKWYYFNKGGDMATGWKQISGKWYYLGSNGKMVTGWQEIDGKWYFFEKSGVMAKGWKQYGGKWYYLLPSGEMVTGCVQISGKWNEFGNTGVWLGVVNSYHADNTTVYVSNEGVYHFACDCSGMTRYTAMTLADARSRGYTPCSVCS